MPKLIILLTSMLPWHNPNKQLSSAHYQKAFSLFSLVCIWSRCDCLQFFSVSVLKLTILLLTSMLTWQNCLLKLTILLPTSMLTWQSHIKKWSLFGYAKWQVKCLIIRISFSTRKVQRSQLLKITIGLIDVLEKMNQTWLPELVLWEGFEGFLQNLNGEICEEKRNYLWQKLLKTLTKDFNQRLEPKTVKTHLNLKNRIWTGGKRKFELLAILCVRFCCIFLEFFFKQWWWPVRN